MPQGTGNGIVHVVRLAVHKSWALVIELTDEGIQTEFLVLHAGQPRSAQNPQRRFGKTLQTGIYPLAMVLPCDYHPHGIQGNTFLIAAKGDGEFFMEIAVEHAAQKALKASVVLKNHIFHGLIPHQTATAAGIPLPGADLVP